MMPPIDKDKAYELTRQAWENVFSSLGGEFSRSCLLASFCLIRVLRDLDPDCDHIFQAGTASFRMVPPEKDTGGSTHYTYQFDEKEALSFFMMGVLPEMHCWVIRVHKQTGDKQIVDILFGHQADNAREMEGNTVEWDSSLLPDGPLWMDVPTESGIAIYRPNATAMQMAHTLIRKACQEAGLVSVRPNSTNTRK